MQLEYSLIGFVAGVLISLTGMGGGSIVTPLLIASGLPPTSAVSTDLIFGAITKYVGAAPHLKSRTADRAVVLLLAAGSVPGSFAAVLVLRHWHQRDAALADAFVERGIALILMLVALVTIVQLVLSTVAPGRLAAPRRTSAAARPPARFLVPIGALVGFTVGMTSIGGGTLLMAALLPLWAAPAMVLVGTDIAHGAILATAASLGHLTVGQVHVPALVLLLAGSIPGVMVGTVIARRLPARVLKGVFAAFLFSIGFRLL